MMRSRTARAWATFSFLLTEDDLTPRFCACHRPADRRLSPRLRRALDELEEAMQAETIEAEPVAEVPGHWIRGVEVD